jgi:hypothetical protein
LPIKNIQSNKFTRKLQGSKIIIFNKIIKYWVEVFFFHFFHFYIENFAKLYPRKKPKLVEFLQILPNFFGRKMAKFRHKKKHGYYVGNLYSLMGRRNACLLHVAFIGSLQAQKGTFFWSGGKYVPTNFWMNYLPLIGFSKHQMQPRGERKTCT